MVTQSFGTERGALLKSTDGVARIGATSISGNELNVYREQLSDGRIHLYFGNSIKEIGAHDRHGREVMRVGYRVYEQEAMLLGLVVPESSAGQHAGNELVTYFLERMEAEGYRFIGTGIINKPMIAQTLVRSGFEPEDRNVLVEILPRRKGDDTRVPNVQVIHNRHNAKLVSGSPGGAFFKIVQPEVVLGTYPITGPESIVAIQTTYSLRAERGNRD